MRPPPIPLETVAGHEEPAIAGVMHVVRRGETLYRIAKAYGIDLADPSEMIAAGRTVEDVRERIGATSLAYLSHDGLVEATQRPASALCRACLTGDYPTEVPVEASKHRFDPVRS